MESLDTQTDCMTHGTWWRDSLVWGSLCAWISAVGYTAANACLRAVIHCDPIWVSCVKAFPTVALVGPWLIVLAHRGERVLPRPRMLAGLLAASVIAQFGGNVMFQWSLGVIGMALGVPITLGTIIVTGAVMGRMFLGESITIRTLVAVAVLIVAIFVLSLGAQQAHRSIVRADDVAQSVSPLWLAAGVLAAAVAGTSYSLLGVVIRYGVTSEVPVSSTLVIVSSTGVVTLGLTSWLRIGLDGMMQTSGADLAVMLLAGVFNAIAFLSLTKALQSRTVTFVNALNASQVAMAAVAGVLIFGEAVTAALIVGVVLTAAGLLMIDGRHERQAAIERRRDKPREEPSVVADGSVQTP